jgi:glycosyltransferase involved in cell wall biosynthesis
VSDAAGRRGRIVLFNENLGGHASLHAGLRAVLGSRAGVDAVFCDLPPPGRLRRALSARIPGIGPRDLDLQPVRYRLAQSVQAHRLLAATLRPGDVLHAYTQSALLCSRGLLARWPSLVATDATIAQGLYHLPYRRPTRHTHLGLRALRRTEQAVYRSATLVVAQSRWAARSLTDAYGVEPERLRVIPYGLPDRPVPRRRAGSEPPAVCFIGASFERKGGTRLVRVVRDRLGGRVTCHVVTRDPLPAAPGVVVHRDLTPGDPRLDDLLARCLALVLPSEMDHSPYALLEAMRAGVAVVATRSGAVPEIVADGETGLLVSHDDAALAGALGALVADPGRAEAMGRAGRRRFERCFDAGRTTAALLEVCDEARRRHRARADRRP